MGNKALETVFENVQLKAETSLQNVFATPFKTVRLTLLPCNGYRNILPVLFSNEVKRFYTLGTRSGR